MSTLAEEVVTLSERLAAYESAVADVVALLGHAGNGPDDLRDAVGQLERLLAGHDRESNDLTGLAEQLRKVMHRDGVTTPPRSQTIVPVVDTPSRSCYSVSRLASDRWRFARIGGWSFDQVMMVEEVDNIDRCPSSVFHEDWRVVYAAARDLVVECQTAASAA